jgi:hypothetical protein
MPVRVNVTLTDATGQPPVGGGAVQILLRKFAATLFDSGRKPYSGATISLAAAGSDDWTHAIVRLEPDSYASQGVTVNRSGSDLYRNNANARAAVAADGSVAVSLPLLRIVEAPGAEPGFKPKPGDALSSIWLQRPPGPNAALLYRELLVTEMRKTRQAASAIETADRFGKKSALGNADDADPWGRFNHVTHSIDPTASGAPLIMEYGETGAVSGGGPRFLVGVWLPARSSTSAAQAFPAWRDFDLLLHPSTAKTWFPVSDYPYAAGYPYPVSENSPAPAADPDRVFQPYVNLALKYATGIWGQFQEFGRDCVFVIPIFPHPNPNSRDEQEYGQPFTTQTGLSRLLAEINLFLHQKRYGWPGSTLDSYAGAKAPTIPRANPGDATAFFLDDKSAPPVRRVAVAGFSASSTQMNTLLVTESVNNSRFPNDRWSGRTSGGMKTWIEAWAIDLIFGSATVAASTFEASLLKWFGQDEARRFVIANCGTTGGDNPDKLYPQLAKQALARNRTAGADSARFAEYWQGPAARWIALFCSNPYLTAATTSSAVWPPFPASGNSDDIHGFMFALSSGLIHGWTRTGRT